MENLGDTFGIWVRRSCSQHTLLVDDSHLEVVDMTDLMFLPTGITSSYGKLF